MVLRPRPRESEPEVGSRLRDGVERPCAVSEHLVERMIRGGARKICFVISPGKSDIVEYFGAGYGESSNATQNLLLLLFNHVVVYPAGVRSDDIQFRASVRLPAGWKFDTALPVEKQEGDRVDFAPVSLTTLVDSPLVAGAHRMGQLRGRRVGRKRHDVIAHHFSDEQNLERIHRVFAAQMVAAAGHLLRQNRAPQQ